MRRSSGGALNIAGAVIADDPNRRKISAKTIA